MKDKILETPKGNYIKSHPNNFRDVNLKSCLC